MGGRRRDEAGGLGEDHERRVRKYGGERAGRQGGLMEGEGGEKKRAEAGEAKKGIKRTLKGSGQEGKRK